MQSFMPSLVILLSQQRCVLFWKLLKVCCYRILGKFKYIDLIINHWPLVIGSFSGLSPFSAAQGDGSKSHNPQIALLVFLVIMILCCEAIQGPSKNSPHQRHPKCDSNGLVWNNRKHCHRQDSQGLGALPGAGTKTGYIFYCITRVLLPDWIRINMYTFVFADALCIKQK